MAVGRRSLLGLLFGGSAVAVTSWWPFKAAKATADIGTTISLKFGPMGRTCRSLTNVALTENGYESIPHGGDLRSIAYAMLKDEDGPDYRTFLVKIPFDSCLEGRKASFVIEAEHPGDCLGLRAELGPIDDIFKRRDEGYRLDYSHHATKRVVVQGKRRA